jgi:hypothetical protein
MAVPNARANGFRPAEAAGELIVGHTSSGNGRTQEAIPGGPLDGAYWHDRETVQEPQLDPRSEHYGEQHTRTANIKMHVETMLAGIAGLIATVIVMVVIGTAVTVAIVIGVSRVGVAWLIMIVGVNEETGEHPRGDGAGHAHSWRERKREHHCPQERTVASACSFQ